MKKMCKCNECLIALKAYNKMTTQSYIRFELQVLVKIRFIRILALKGGA